MIDWIFCPYCKGERQNDCPYEKKAEQKKKCIHNWVDIDKMESTFKCTKCKETLCIKFYPEKQEHKCVCKECANWQERG